MGGGSGQRGGASGWGEGGQGGCERERRSETFVKIRKKKSFLGGGDRVGWGGIRLGGVRVDVNGEACRLWSTSSQNYPILAANHFVL